MTLCRRFWLIVAFCVILSGVPTYCYGIEDCNCWEGTCPNTVPPCVKVVFTGIEVGPGWHYPPYNVHPPPPNGKIFMLKFQETCCDWYDTYYIDDSNNWQVRWSPDHKWSPDYNDTSKLGLIYDHSDIGEYNFTGLSHHYHFLDFEIYWDRNENPICQTSFTNRLDPEDEDWTYGFGGTATVEYVWDCSACGYECALDVDVSGYKDPLYYARIDCCPPAEKGEDTTVTFSCTDAEYVIPTYKVETPDPNDPTSSDWIEVSDCNLVDVNSIPSECSEGSSVSFHIQALIGKPPARARVTVTGSFYDNGTGGWGSASRTVYIEPDSGDCCDSCGGGGGSPGAGGGPGAGGCSGGSCAIKPFGFGSGPPPPGTSCPILLGVL